MSEHTELLRRYNEWRRGADTEMPHPTDIGRALDWAIEAMEKVDELEHQLALRLEYCGEAELERDLYKAQVDDLRKLDTENKVLLVLIEEQEQIRKDARRWQQVKDNAVILGLSLQGYVEMDVVTDEAFDEAMASYEAFQAHRAKQLTKQAKPKEVPSE